MPVSAAVTFLMHCRCGAAITVTGSRSRCETGLNHAMPQCLHPPHSRPSRPARSPRCRAFFPGHTVAEDLLCIKTLIRARGVASPVLCSVPFRAAFSHHAGQESVIQSTERIRLWSYDRRRPFPRGPHPARGVSEKFIEIQFPGCACPGSSAVQEMHVPEFD